MEMDATAMTKLMDSLNGEIDAVYPSKIMPEKDTEISFDRMSTFRCVLSLIKGFDKSVIGSPKCIMEYQDEELFFAYITGDYVENHIIQPVIHLVCAKHRRFGLKVVDIYCSLKGQDQWFKMEAKKSKENAELLQHFTVKWNLDFQCSMKRPIQFDFDIKVAARLIILIT
ncbi:hypothetical protein DAPPUDRAFT_324421 [Daphnia pulex]|uniref:Uncharacterized protein n=1 Tax=Daphnia pulex TaxID=6669 RepID=E9H1E2_DAPPU|nr:hypothetical protein DAPPUDRAFT_324421 [Daphnia pulex]|eukprot:EFX74432.1 hypothetical protein DAPPUDRAFT_324421 [Daphnia pulex]